MKARYLAEEPLYSLASQKYNVGDRRSETHHRKDLELISTDDLRRLSGVHADQIWDASQ